GRGNPSGQGKGGQGCQAFGGQAASRGRTHQGPSQRRPAFHCGGAGQRVGELDQLPAAGGAGVGSGGHGPGTVRGVRPAGDRAHQPDRSVDVEANLAWDKSGRVHDGRVYAIWTQEVKNESDDMNVMFQYSDDEGASWSQAVRLNDDGTTNSQFNPAIALDQTS